MSQTVTLEIPAEREALVRRVLALTEELDHLALNAPPGTVFDACEAAVLTGGRDLQRQLLESAVARCVEAAEKKSPRSESVRAVAAKKTEAPKTANS